MEKLFLAVLEWNHGEYETVDCRIVHASSMEEAVAKVERHLSEMWGGETQREGELFAPSWGYPAVRLSSIEEVGVERLLEIPVLNIR